MVQNVLDIAQKVQRWVIVAFTTVPFQYRKKRLNILRRLFVVTNEYMKSTGATYWIDYGTLLGQYREKDIISHDMDIDYGVHEDEFEKIWSQRHKLPKGFKLYNTSFRHRGPKLYFNYKGFDADIYFYEAKNGTLTSYENSNYQSEKTPYPKDLALPTQKAQFLGEETFVPAQPKEYLKHIYHYLGQNGKRDLSTGYWYEIKN
ncbi:MAG: LicD family protein [Reichenbachiella sp.]|uniref:LicD family protein n=1 Tax=Reichenbachiella sp. TaxID=2184521 RepID=UPI003297F87C